MLSSNTLTISSKNQQLELQTKNAMNKLTLQPQIYKISSLIVYRQSRGQSKRNQLGLTLTRTYMVGN